MVVVMMSFLSCYTRDNLHVTRVVNSAWAETCFRCFRGNIPRDFTGSYGRCLRYTTPWGSLDEKP